MKNYSFFELCKALYDGVLTSDNDKLRYVVLQNFDNYLREEDKKLSDLESKITKPRTIKPTATKVKGGDKKEEDGETDVKDGV